MAMAWHEGQLAYPQEDDHEGRADRYGATRSPPHDPHRAKRRRMVSPQKLQEQVSESEAVMRAELVDGLASPPVAVAYSLLDDVAEHYYAQEGATTSAHDEQARNQATNLSDTSPTASSALSLSGSGWRRIHYRHLRWHAVLQTALLQVADDETRELVARLLKLGVFDSARRPRLSTRSTPPARAPTHTAQARISA